MRHVALELVVEEILGRLFHRDELVDMARALEPPGHYAGDERAIHLYAVELVKNAIRRDQPYSAGGILYTRRPDPGGK